MGRWPQSVLPKPQLTPSSSMARRWGPAAPIIVRISSGPNRRGPFAARSLRMTFLPGRLKLGPNRTGFGIRPAS